MGVAGHKSARKVGVAAALGLLLLLLGCGTPQQRYKVLSFFFDGVPDPNAPKGTVASASGGKPSYLHNPFANGKCNACHQSEDPFSPPHVTAATCLACHTQVPGEYPLLHGPVASGQCQFCHTPHQSTEPHLLKLSSPRICQQCHEPGSISPKVAEHTDPKADCMSCHSGHGGSDRHFLKASYTPAPATAPTTRSVAGVSAGASLKAERLSLALPPQTNSGLSGNGVKP